MKHHGPRKRRLPNFHYFYLTVASRPDLKPSVLKTYLKTANRILFAHRLGMRIFREEYGDSGQMLIKTRELIGDEPKVVSRIFDSA